MRKLLFLIIFLISCLPFQKQSTPKQVYVLCFHTFVGHASYIDFSKEELRQVITLLLDKKHKVITLQNFVDGTFEGTKNILITIDDGNRSVYTAYFEVLKPLGIRPVIAIYTNRPQQDPSHSLTWEQIKRLSKECDIVSHGYNHRPLDFKTTSNTFHVYEEITKSKAMLENTLNQKCNVFVYPYGKYIPYCFDLLNYNSYTYAFALGDKPVVFPIQNKYVIPRIMVTRGNINKLLHFD